MTDSNTEIISTRISYLMLTHGSLRSAAKAVGIDAAYLCRLYRGEKTNPSDATLAKLGIRKVVTYVVDP
jgi:hypothetical protein